MGDFLSEEKRNASFKHLYSIAGTKNEDGTLGKAWYEESYSTGHFITNDDVWIDTVPSASTPAEADINTSNNPSIIQKYTLYTLTLDSSSNGTVWVANETVGDSTSDILKNWILPQKFGQGYTLKLYDNNDTEITTTEMAGWIFDYLNGFLILGNGSSPSSQGYAEPLKITGYRYVGQTLDTSTSTSNECILPIYVESFSSITSRTFTHNLNSTNIICRIYCNNIEIDPASLIIDDSNNVTITFTSSTSGRICIQSYINSATNGYTEEITTPSTSWTVSHNFNTFDLQVAVYNDSNELVIPDTITSVDNNNLQITFTTETAGKCVVIADDSAIDTMYSNSFTSAATWTIDHNLADSNVVCTVWDDSNTRIYPDELKISCINQVVVTFSSATQGHITVSKSCESNNHGVQYSIKNHFDVDNNMSPSNGDIIQYKDSIWTSSINPSLKKHIIDEISGFEEIYPLTINKFTDDANGSGFKWVYENWSSLSQYNKWQITNITTGQVIDNLDFTSPSDFIDWKNSNIPNDGSHFTQYIILSCYTVENPSIPQISKVYGQNRLYAFLRARNNGTRYRGYKSTNACLTPDYSLPSGKDILCDAWNYVMPFNLSSDNFDNSHNGARAVFTCQSHKHTYGIVSPKQVIVSSTSNKRYVYDDSINDFVSGSSDHAQLFVPVGISNINCITEYDLDARSHNTYHYNDNDRVLSHLLINNVSCCLFTRLDGLTNSNHNAYAIYISPMGDDIFYISAYDTSKYQIECVYFNNSLQPRYKQVNLDIERSSVRRNSFGIRLQDILESWMITNFRRTHSYGLPRIYFRLRDMSTGYVGPLSNAYIEYYDNSYNDRSTYMPFGFYVRNK